MPAIGVSSAILSLTCIIAALSMHGLALRNGTITIPSPFSLPGAFLPNTRTLFQAPKTGIEHLDNYAALMNAIFWVDLDPRNVVAHTGGSHFLGTLSASWIIMLVEGHRIGGGFLAWTYILEFLGELAGLGMLTPIWALLHLSTLHKARSQGVKALHKHDSIALFVAFILGHILPTAMMVLTTPEGSGWQSQQYWVLARLAHPIFTFTIFQVVKLLVPKTTETVSARAWYISALVLGTVMHALSLAPLAMPILAPGWIEPRIAKQLDPVAIFIPAPFWLIQPERVDFVTGVSQFLQWDEILTSIAICTFAVTLYLQRKEDQGHASVGSSTLAVGAGLLALGGPGAAAAYVMLERDEVQPALNKTGQKKNQ